MVCFFLLLSHTLLLFRLIVIQLILPNISFLGHLSGILAGTCHLYGGWNCLLPNEALLLRLESVAAQCGLTSYPSFVSTSASTYSTLSISGALTEGSVLVRSWASSVLERWHWRPTVMVDDGDDLNGLLEMEESDTTSPLVS
jgi:hypothetical protein